jgi:hypothetical protein
VCSSDLKKFDSLFFLQTLVNSFILFLILFLGGLQPSHSKGYRGVWWGYCSLRVGLLFSKGGVIVSDRWGYC